MALLPCPLLSKREKFRVEQQDICAPTALTRNIPTVTPDGRARDASLATTGDTPPPSRNTRRCISPTAKPLLRNAGKAPTAPTSLRFFSMAPLPPTKDQHDDTKNSKNSVPRRVRDRPPWTSLSVPFLSSPLLATLCPSHAPNTDQPHIWLLC